jgi:hypothetical protein
MAHRTLTLLEVTGIQPYIFGSNQLAQNIGASELVMQATTQAVITTLNRLGWSHNGRWDDNAQTTGPGVQYDGRSLEDGLDVEIAYAGGGNAMLLFREHSHARTFVQRLTRELLTAAPGLRLVAAHADFDEQDDVLADVHYRLRGNLAHRKHDHPLSTPLLGLGVTAECVYTGLPATGYDDDPATVGHDAAQKIEQIPGFYERRPIAAAVAAKLKAERAGKRRLDKVLPQVKGSYGYDFIYDFGELGEPGESSYIAVVHADGNQMGKRFDALRDRHNSAEENAAYVRALRGFSLSVRRRARRALSQTVDYLFASRDRGDAKGKFGGEVRTPRNRAGEPVLPFRPIVFGGDDITFVCDGRLGLDLAAFYLNAFCEEGHDGEALVGGPVYARAGVAVVKTHYPFSRAYDLAEALAKKAKAAIGARKPQKQKSATVMDWHFATTGMMFDIDEIRGREYEDSNGRSLLMRPIALKESAPTWRTWRTFTTLMETFQKEEWKNMRNKVLALRDALRQGERAVELFRATHDQVNRLPSIPGRPDMAQRGWQDNACGYYDAIEAIDFFVSLKREKEATT